MTKTKIQKLCAGLLSEEKAIEIAKTGFWKDGWTDVELFELQINQRRIVMDFSAFHKATESALERPVWTHEFGDFELLLSEYRKESPNPLEEAGSQEAHVLGSFFRAREKAIARHGKKGMNKSPKVILVGVD